jgi:hypothetical protein
MRFGDEQKFTLQKQQYLADLSVRIIEISGTNKL